MEIKISYSFTLSDTATKFQEEEYGEKNGQGRSSDSRGKRERRNKKNNRRFGEALQWISNICIIWGVNSFSENCSLLIVLTEPRGPTSILVLYDSTSLTVTDWVTTDI